MIVEGGRKLQAISGENETRQQRTLHELLAHSNRRRLSPHRDGDDWQADIDEEAEVRRLECGWIEHERALIADVVSEVPRDARGFQQWFERLVVEGPGQDDELFPWLANQASFADMRWFLTQEVAGEAGFEDLLALTQVKLPVRAKLEMARNFWDEMGRGKEPGMHGLMLQRIVDELKLTPAIESTVWESLALSNLMIGLAINRRYTYQSIGALGVIELTAPSRVSKVNDGLARLGLAAKSRAYYLVHASLDVAHSASWNREVILPLVQDEPARAAAIAEGALLRLRAGARCFRRYRAELWNRPAVAPLTLVAGNERQARPRDGMVARRN